MTSPPDPPQCPPWCITDHGTYTFHGSARITVDVPQHHQVAVRAIANVLPPYLASVRITGTFGLVRASGDETEDVAALIEQLAGAAPEGHRELAAAIRSAAALIAGLRPAEEDGTDDH